MVTGVEEAIEASTRIARVTQQCLPDYRRKGHWGHNASLVHPKVMEYDGHCGDALKEGFKENNIKNCPWDSHGVIDTGMKAESHLRGSEGRLK